MNTSIVIHPCLDPVGSSPPHLAPPPSGKRKEEPLMKGLSRFQVRITLQLLPKLIQPLNEARFERKQYNLKSQLQILKCCAASDF